MVSDNLRKRNKDVDSTAGETQPNGSIDDHQFDDPSNKVFKPIKSLQERNNNNISLFGIDADWKTPLFLTFLAIFTRAFKISWAQFVVWDEAHFGKFASFYLKREFYFDVHPPLGKMLLGLSGVMAGYNGTFKFESGTEYPPEINYTVMRLFCSMFGAMMVPLAYFTAIQLKMTKSSAVLCASMVLLDLALLTISRFILLDSMLLYFTCQSAFCLVTFRNYQRTGPLSSGWWFWLTATGISIGQVASVKWVGFFAIALVGLQTLSELWEMFGDLSMPKKTYLTHWAARIVCLIIIPVFIYMASFWLHFFILDGSGSGDAQMSSLFQAGLRGNSFDKNPLEIAYGSVVSLKNNGHGGGLLHSHVQRFPGGSEQQQVTCYHHKDSNNDFIIKKPWLHSDLPDEPEWVDVHKEKGDFNEEGVEFLNDGDIIRLVHASTGRNLHSHRVPAPVTSYENEVSCYGNETVGDINDHWKVEIVSHVGPWTNRIRSLSTVFRLRHLTVGCLLKSHSVTLPSWGFKQAEVVCERRFDNYSKNNHWNVELHVNDKLPPAGPNVYKSRFLKDFVDLNVAMWTSNNALTPDPDKEPDNLVSQPWQWPLLTVGLRMCGWDDNKVKFFLMGHPLVWWGVAVSVVWFLGIVAYYCLRDKIKLRNFETDEDMNDFMFGCYIGFGGWFLHYIPFWLMGRVTYLHHYFPAVYFGIILLTFLIDFTAKRNLNQTAHVWVNLVIGFALFWMFLFFKDFAFGFDVKAEEYKNRQWFEGWAIYGDFHDD